MSIGIPPPLLERELELVALGAAMADAERSAGRLTVIEGPAGIGKTRLVEAARSLGQSKGLRVLSARGHELERDFPYGAVRQLYEPAVAAAGAKDRGRWLSGAAGLVPRLMSETPAPVSGDAEGVFARLHGLYWLFANIAADGPVAVLVDDAQWVDDPTLRFLGFLARRVHELRLAVVIATRPAELGRQPLLRDLTADPTSVWLRPSPLSVEAVASWIAADLGDGTDRVFAEACRDVTSGYPFFVRELLHEIRAEQLPLRAEAALRVRELGPGGVASVVLVRLARLPGVAGEVARSLAVLGDGARPKIVARLAALDEEALATGVDRLVAADLLERGTPLRFVHPIIRSAILAALGPGELASRHGEAARLLHENGASLEQVAAHLLAANDVDEPWALEVLRLAGGDALSRGGPEAAVKYLERVAVATPAGPQRATALLELGRAEALAGEHSAFVHLRQAIQSAADPLMAGKVSLTLGRTLKGVGQSLEACDVLEAALEGSVDPGLRDSLEAELLGLTYWDADARERLRSRLATLGDPGHASRSAHHAVVLASLAAESQFACEPVDRVVSLARRMLAAWTAPADPYENFAVLVVAMVLTVCDRFDEADATFSELRDEARRRGWLVGYLSAVSRRSMMHYRRGALREAEADATEVLTRASELHDPQTADAWAQSARTFVALERWDKNELSALLQRVEVTGVADSPSGWSAVHSRGLLRAAAGDKRGGLADLLTAGEQEQRWHNANPALSWWRSDAALILMGLGEQQQAQRLAEEELELARRFGASRAVGIALRAAALTRSDSPDRNMLEEAVEVLSTSGAQLEHARALVDLGAAIRRGGHPARAREVLRRGYELGTRCGARALCDRGMKELLSAGARPRRTAISGVESLTPSELRVAELAADGMTNREIAQALFVTERTVETHLGHVFPKLDIASRTELAGKLKSRDPERPAELFNTQS